MDENSFIASQLRDLVNKIDFEPFFLTLLNSTALDVRRPEDVTILSGGFLYHEQDGSLRIVPYDKILCIQTIFDL